MMLWLVPPCSPWGSRPFPAPPFIRSSIVPGCRCQAAAACTGPGTGGDPQGLGGTGGMWEQPRARGDGSPVPAGGARSRPPPDKGSLRRRRLCSRAAPAAARPGPAGAPGARDLRDSPRALSLQTPVRGRGLGCIPPPRRLGMLPPYREVPALTRGSGGPPACRGGSPSLRTMGAGVPSPARAPRGCQGSPNRRGRGRAGRAAAPVPQGLLQRCGGGC